MVMRIILFRNIQFFETEKVWTVRLFLSLYHKLLLAPPNSIIKRHNKDYHILHASTYLDIKKFKICIVVQCTATGKVHISLTWPKWGLLEWWCPRLVCPQWQSLSSFGSTSFLNMHLNIDHVTYELLITCRINLWRDMLKMKKKKSKIEWKEYNFLLISYPNLAT